MHQYLQFIRDTAYSIYHNRHLIDQDWKSGGLATSDDAETQAMSDAVMALSDLFEDLTIIDSIYFFSDSTNTAKMVLNSSIHSVQTYALATLTVLDSWMKASGINMVFFYHVPNSADAIFEPHLSVHNLASSVKTEAGRSAVRTIAFSRKQITTDMLNSWAGMYRLSQNFGSNFQYPRCSINPIEHVRARRMLPSHLKGGTWLKDVDHNAFLTAQMVRGLTAHAPIGHYRHRFK